MKNKIGRTMQRTNNLRDELISGCTPAGDKRWCIIAQIERYSSFVVEN